MAILPSLDGFDLETRLSLAYSDHVASDQKVHVKLVHLGAARSRDAKKMKKKKKKSFIKPHCL